MSSVGTWLLQELLSEANKHRAVIQEFAPGESIFRVGDAGDFLCVLLSGSVEIRKGDKLITIVTPGDMFGEMGLIDHQVRSADAVAASHSRIALVREGQFMSLLEGRPHFALAIMRLLTDRFRRRTET